MTATYHGSKTIGGCFPTTASAQLAIDAAIAVSLPSITAKIAGALEAQAAITLNPPTLAGNLVIAQNLVLGLQAAITVGAPSVDASLSALAGLLAELETQAADLQAKAAFSAALAVTLGGAGVHLYSYEGRAGDAGSSLSAILSGGPPGIGADDQIFAVLPAVSAPISISMLRGFMGL